jgi:FkbM family methyltransferase
MHHARRLSHPRRLLRERRLVRRGIEPRDFYAYNLPWLARIPFDSVLDIGAARGSHTLIFHQLFPDAEIHAFEPLPQSAQQLAARVQGLDRIKVWPWALSDQNGRTRMHLGGSGFLNSSSLLTMLPEHARLWPGSASPNFLDVDTRRLDDVIPPDRYKRILIKMDVQGAERLVLRGGKQTFGSAAVVVSEVSFQPLYEGGVLFDELLAEFCQLGFQFRGMLGQASAPSGDGSIVQADAVFLRK